MKRDLLKIRRGDSGCCPGHDTYPDDSYKNRRSKKARARGKQMEHKLVRQLHKRALKKELE